METENKCGGCARFGRRGKGGLCFEKSNHVLEVHCSEGSAACNKFQPVGKTCGDCSHWNKGSDRMGDCKIKSNQYGAVFVAGKQCPACDKFKPVGKTCGECEHYIVHTRETAHICKNAGVGDGFCAIDSNFPFKKRKDIFTTSKTSGKDCQGFELKAEAQTEKTCGECAFLDLSDRVCDAYRCRLKKFTPKWLNEELPIYHLSNREACSDFVSNCRTAATPSYSEMRDRAVHQLEKNDLNRGMFELKEENARLGYENNCLKISSNCAYFENGKCWSVQKITELSTDLDTYHKMNDKLRKSKIEIKKEVVRLNKECEKANSLIEEGITEVCLHKTEIQKLKEEKDHLINHIRNNEDTRNMSAFLNPCLGVPFVDPIETKKINKLETQLKTANEMLEAQARQLGEIREQRNDFSNKVVRLKKECKMRSEKEDGALSEAFDLQRRLDDMFTAQQHAANKVISSEQKIKELEGQKEQLERDKARWRGSCEEQNEQMQSISRVNHKIRSDFYNGLDAIKTLNFEIKNLKHLSDCRLKESDGKQKIIDKLRSEIFSLKATSNHAACVRLRILLKDRDRQIAEQESCFETLKNSKLMGTVEITVELEEIKEQRNHLAGRVGTLECQAKADRAQLSEQSTLIDQYGDFNDDLKDQIDSLVDNNLICANEIQKLRDKNKDLKNQKIESAKNCDPCAEEFKKLGAQEERVKITRWLNTGSKEHRCMTVDLHTSLKRIVEQIQNGAHKCFTG